MLDRPQGPMWGGGETGRAAGEQGLREVKTKALFIIVCWKEQRKQKGMVRNV